MFVVFLRNLGCEHLTSLLFNWLFFEEKSWGNNGGVLKWGEGGLFMLDTGPPANAGDAVQSLK